MSDFQSHYQGIVLDEPVAHALLRLAIEENLVDNDPHIGDGFVNRILGNSHSYDDAQNAMEYLVLGGKLFVPFWLPREWKGEIFERGLVIPLEPKLDEETIEVNSLPADVLLGMLRSRGIQWSEEDLYRRYEQYLESYRKWESVADDKSYDGLEIRMALSNLMPISPDEYTQEQLDSWRAVQKVNAELRPVLECIKAYRQVLTTCLERGALSAVPIATAVSNEIIETKPNDSELQLSLLRLTCSEFGRIPIGRTLKNTIEMAETSEAAALRERIVSWTNAAHAGEAAPLEFALRDIAQARKELKTAKTINRAGSYITVIGASATAISLPGSIPLAAGISVIATFAGAATLAGQKFLETRNKWAMMGQI